MFTGITDEIGTVRSVQPDKLTVAADTVLQDMAVGHSVNVNGVCLTVTHFDTAVFSVDIMLETAGRTNLGQLGPGDGVNLERALSLAGRLGGHLVQGHIDALGRVAWVTPESDAVLVGFEAPAEAMRYVVEKGFIAVDGVSLTVVRRSATAFEVSVVDFTRRHTTLGEKKVGDPVNLEVDIIAKYVEAFTRPDTSGITTDFLREHGFLVG